MQTTSHSRLLGIFSFVAGDSDGRKCFHDTATLSQLSMRALSAFIAGVMGSGGLSPPLLSPSTYTEWAKIVEITWRGFEIDEFNALETVKA